MKTTETVYKCDGVPDRGTCGRIIAYGTGVVVRGTIVAVNPDAPLVGKSSDDETVLCFDCLRRRLRMRDPEPRVVEKIVEVPMYHDNYETPGKGPTGPMAPPDLPRYVGVVANLAGGRR